MNVLELFSGIGGMHFALKESNVPAKIVEAVDINTTANEVYVHNFPQTKLCQNNVQVITPDYISSREIDLILMSPPCQPFTRLGKKKDIEDSRCAALLHLIQLIPHSNEKLKYILLENVEGFQNSDARQSLITVLENTGFHYREILLSPKDLGFPNSRKRYYLLGKKNHLKFSKCLNEMEYLCTNLKMQPLSIGDLLEIPDNSEDYAANLLSDETLIKRARLLDIITKKSKNSCCFTRGYTHYIEGTGSVYCPFDDDVIRATYEKEKTIGTDCNEERLKLLRALRLRFFTPKEIANLLCFPDSFSFPNNTSIKQRYKLLGNSINVKVVAKLIQLLISES